MKLPVLTTILACAFTATLHAAAPLISDVADPVIAQNTSTVTNYLTVGDAETPFIDLVVTATSANTNLVPNTPANLILGGTNAQRTLNVTPTVGQTGTTTITLMVSDGTNTVKSGEGMLSIRSEKASLDSTQTATLFILK